MDILEAARLFMRRIRHERDLIGLAEQGGAWYAGYALARDSGVAVAVVCALCGGSGDLSAATQLGRAILVSCPVCSGTARMDPSYADFAAGYDDAQRSDVACWLPLDAAAPPFRAHAGAVFLTRSGARARVRAAEGHRIPHLAYSEAA